jgi:hypothetical protein
MRGFAHFQVFRSRYFRAWADELRRIEQTAAVVALVPPRRVVTAAWTGPLYITVGQKAPVINRVDLPGGSFLDIAVILQLVAETLREFPILDA